MTLALFDQTYLKEVKSMLNYILFCSDPSNLKIFLTKIIWWFTTVEVQGMKKVTMVNVYV